MGDITTGSGGDDDGPDPNACIDRAATLDIPEAHTHLAGNTTNAGVGCMDPNCHNTAVPGTDAPPFLFGGTAYKADGKTPNAGAFIRVIGKGAEAKPVVADTAGNFYALANAAFTFPALANGTACPNVTKMVTPLAAADGNCNRGSCHSPAGTVGQGPISVQ